MEKLLIRSVPGSGPAFPARRAQGSRKLHQGHARGSDPGAGSPYTREMRSIPVVTGVLLLCLAAACTRPASEGATGDDDDDDGSTPGWTQLMTADWALEPFSEETSDVHVLTLDRDIYVGGIRPVAPPGTHHTVLAIGNLASQNMIYASGVGTGALDFPDGVGLKLSAGVTLVLQLHLFNVSELPLEGTSGIEIIEVPESDVTDLAGLFLPGPLDLSLLPNQATTISDTCNVGSAQNLFALIPHMHQLGTHFKTTVTAGGTTTVLHDEPYYFDGQGVTAFTPIAVGPGDTIGVECTWNNTYDTPVGWGESSTTEMCFAITYRWPDTGGDFCTSMP